jgi:hypothetical protein
MLQGASPSLHSAQFTNWQTILEAIHKKNLWDVQHVVDSLQTEQSSVATASIRFPQKVSYNPLYMYLTMKVEI